MIAVPSHPRTATAYRPTSRTLAPESSEPDRFGAPGAGASVIAASQCAMGVELDTIRARTGKSTRPTVRPELTTLTVSFSARWS